LKRHFINFKRNKHQQTYNLKKLMLIAIFGLTFVLKTKRELKNISMNKFLVNLIPLLIFTTAGFYSVSISNDQQKVDDLL